MLDQVIQTELGHFENRLQRCFVDCQDNARDKFPEMTSNQAQHEKARTFVLAGANGCADKHIALLKSVQAKIEADLDKIDFTA